MLLCKSVYSYIPGLNPGKCVLMRIASNRYSMFLAREKMEAGKTWKSVNIREIYIYIFSHCKTVKRKTDMS